MRVDSCADRQYLSKTHVKPNCYLRFSEHYYYKSWLSEILCIGSCDCLMIIGEFNVVNIEQHGYN
jgi:hypothetical protein